MEGDTRERLREKLPLLPVQGKDWGEFSVWALPKKGLTILAHQEGHGGTRGDGQKRLEEAGSEGELLQIDVTSRERTEKMAKFAKERFGKIEHPHQQCRVLRRP